MVPEEERPPSKEQKEELRQTVLTMVKEKGKEMFEETDLVRFQEDDSYLERFWIHGFFIPGSDRIKNTSVLVTESLRWRKEFGVLALKETDLDKGLKEEGSLYTRGRDTQGGKCLVFAVKRYVKDAKLAHKRRQFFVYMLERLDRETGGQKITIIFDCQNAGIRNVELEAIQFIMQVLIHYYPNVIRRILVHEMPWVMNAVWKVVKSLLPGPAQERIKFCTKANLGDYTDVSSLPRELGGEDDWEYSWQSEHTTHNVGKTGETQRQAPVHYCSVEPRDALQFRCMESGTEMEASLTVCNRSTKLLAYKVRSTRPTLFLVTPHSGLLSPDQQLNIRIHTTMCRGPIQVLGERFQVSVVTEVEPGEQVKQVFEDKQRPVELHVLRCEEERRKKPSSGGVDTGTMEHSNKLTRTLSRKLGEMEERMSQLRLLLVLQCFLLILGLGYFLLSTGLATVTSEL